MESGDDTKYISLREATEHCGYSRDYLNLRIRQGKLKGVKIGRNWVITRQWLKDYMDSVSDIQYSTAGGYETSIIQKDEPLDEVGVRNVSDVVFESHLTREEFEKLPGQLAPVNIEVMAGEETNPEEALKTEIKIPEQIATPIFPLACFQPQLSRRYWRLRTNFASLIAFLVLVAAVTTGYAFAQIDPADIIESGFVNESTRFLNDANNGLVSSNEVFLGEISHNAGDKSGNDYHGLLTFVDASIGNVKIPSVNLSQPSLAWLRLGWALPQPELSWPDLPAVSLPNLSHISISQFSPPRFSLPAGALAKVGLPSIPRLSVAHFGQEDIAMRAGLPDVPEISFDNFKTSISELTSKLTFQELKSSLDNIKNEIVQSYFRILSFFVPENESQNLESPSYAKASEGKQIQNIQSQINQLSQSFNQLKQTPFVIKEVTREVSKITQINPVTEITKKIIEEKHVTQEKQITNEITKTVEPADLAKIQQDISNQTLSIQSLQAQLSSVRSSDGYVQNPRLYQENQDLILSTINSGSILLSAAQSAYLTGQKIILDAAGSPDYKTAPSIELRDDTNIKGNAAITGTLTVGTGTTTITESSINVGSGKFIADSSGNITIAGTLTQQGASASSTSAPLTITSSTTPQLSLRYDANNKLDVTTSSTGAITFDATGSGSSLTINDNLYLLGTLSLPNSNTITGQTNYAQFSNGISVGGATTYYINSSGLVNLANLNTTSNATIGTNFSAASNNFLVDASGNVTAVSLNLGSGSITAGPGSFTTLTSTGATTLGNNSSTVSIDSSDWDISSTGAISNATYEGLTITSTTGTLTISAGKTLTVNNSLTLSGADAKTINFGSNSITLTTSSDTTLTLPTTGTVATLAGVETFTNKTLTSPAINGTVTTSGVTLPAFSMGGNISGNSYNIGTLGNLTLADDKWIGLGSTKGLIEFDDQSTDEVNILNANVGLGTSAPVTKLNIIDSAIPPLLSLGSTTSATWSFKGGDGTGWADATYERVFSLGTYNGKLYAGLGSSQGDGELWEYNGSTWTRVGGDGTGWADATFEFVYSLGTYNGKLYAGLGGSQGDAEVWEYNGSTWTRVGGDGTGWADNTYEQVNSLATYNGKLYAGLGESQGDAELWEYNGSTWTRVGGDGTGWADATYDGVKSLITYNGNLYAGLGNSQGEAEVWRYNGSTWTLIGGDGTGWADATYERISAITVYNGKLYIGLGVTAGDAELWEYNGSTWTRVGGDGTGWADATFEYVYELENYNGKLYATLGNSTGDDDVWEYDGSTWTRIAGDGTPWANATYEYVYSLSSYNGKLYAGLGTSQGEAEVWEYDGSGWTTFARNGVGISIGDYIFFGRNGYVGIGNPDPGSTLDILGDLKVDTSLLVAANGIVSTLGNVGIGTATPTDKLDISGGVKIGSGYAGIATTAPANGLLVQGNVGIGTTSPVNKLYVYTTTNGDGITVDGTGNPAFAIGNSGTIKAYMALATGAGSYANGSAANDLVFRTEDGTNGKIMFATQAGNLTVMTMTRAGDVGIGTTSPGAILNVFRSSGTEDEALDVERQTGATGVMVGNVNNIAHSTGDMTDGFGPAYTFYIGDNTSANTAIAEIGGVRDGADNSGKLVFRTNNAGTFGNRMVLDKSGNVGIGTTNPTDALDISGGVKIGSGYAGIATTAPANGLLVQGNVGIGTTSPSQKMEINGNALLNVTRPELQLLTSGTEKGRVAVYSEGAVYLTANLSYNGTSWNRDSTSFGGSIIDISDVLPFRLRYVASGANPATLTEFMSVDTSGNVGIGDATPDAKFDFDYSNTSTTAATKYGSFFTLSDTGAVTTGADTLYGARISTTRTGATGGTINTYGLYSDVTGDTGGTSNAYGGYFTIAGNTSPDTLYGLYSTISVTSPSTGYGLYVDAGTGTGTEYAAAFMNGNVGIGLTNPAYAIDVKRTSANALISATETGAGQYLAGFYATTDDSSMSFYAYDDGYTAVPAYTGKAGIQASSGNLFLSAFTADQDIEFYAGGRTPSELRMFIDGTSGYAGIGTTTPTDILDISGGVKIGSGYAGIATTAPANGLLVQGNVGIGTTSPGYKLEINGDTALTYDIPSLQTATNYAYPTLQASDQAYTWFRTNTGTYSWVAGSENSGANVNTFRISRVTNNANTDTAIGTRTAYLTIDTSGNVGIGTANPTDLLDISGGVKIGSGYAGIATTAPANGLLVQGNVGIGTTAPGQLLQLYGANPAIRLTDSGDATNRTWDIYANYAANGDFALLHKSAARLYIQDGGNVGIGTSAPNAALEIYGPTQALSGNGNLLLRSSDDIAADKGGTLTFAGWYRLADPHNWTPFAAISGRKEIPDDNVVSGYLVFATTPNANPWVPLERMRINSSGNVGIGTTNPGSYRLYLAGAEAYCDQTTCWNDASDITLKTNITQMNYGLNEILELNPVRFTMKSNGQEGIGFIAQEVKPIIPEIVSGEEGNMGIAYGGLTPILTKAIQEQQLEIEELKLSINQNDMLAANNIEITNNLGQNQESFFGQILGWLSDKVVTAREFIAEKISANQIKAKDKLCVGETCVTESQLKELLEKNSITTIQTAPPPPPLDLQSQTQSKAESVTVSVDIAPPTSPEVPGIKETIVESPAIQEDAAIPSLPENPD